MVLFVTFQSFCKSEPASNIQQLKNDKNLVNGIIQNLPNLYAHQASEVFCSFFLCVFFQEKLYEMLL